VSRLVLLLIALLLPSGLSAQSAAPPSTDTLRIPRGVPVERVAAGTDTTLHYAVYVPTAPAAAHLPVLLVMDPRGRALLPLGLVRRAAERYGFLVLSSYDTLSDDPTALDRNTRALTAMLVDAQVRFGADPARLYLVGFSGTAQFALAVASQLDGHLAGIVGVGGGLRPSSSLVIPALRVARPFAYMGIAGRTDFNYDGARELDRALDDTPLPHRFVVPDGPHAWPPEAVVYDAVEWLHLQAVRAGLVPRDDRWVDSLRTAHLAEAQALDAAGRPVNAQRRYREVAADFEGLGGAPIATHRRDSLAADRRTRRAEARQNALAERVAAYTVTVGTFAADYRRAPDPPSHAAALRQLEIERLRRMEGADDPDESAAAQRMLATVYAVVAFYEPRDHMERRDYARAAGLLRLAVTLRPDDPFVCLDLARAEAQQGHTPEALEALTCAIDAGAASRAALATDPLLAPLYSDPAFDALLARAPLTPPGQTP